jgi:exodeoxyribonuclease VII small subunit
VAARGAPGAVVGGDAAWRARLSILKAPPLPRFRSGSTGVGPSHRVTPRHGGVRGADYNPATPTMVKHAPAAAPPEPASYEAALNELERLVAAMEAGQLPLDQLLDSYRRGATLLGFCRGRLEAVEQQVQLLEDGQLKSWGAS